METIAARPPRRRAAWWPLLALAPLAALVFVPLPSLGRVRWELVPLLALLAVLHYLCAAVTLRAASGHPLPLREATLAQFTAAAANRVTPGGLGAAAVNTRYLVCRGLPLPRAAVAVAAAHVAGLPADLLLAAAVLAASRDGRLLGVLGDHAGDAARAVPVEAVLAAAGLALAAAAVWGRRALRSAAARQAVAGLRDLCRRPRDFALMMAASAATTLVMGTAFALSALAVPGAGAAPGALLIAYLIGAAAGTAVPVPGGVGSTEAALTAALAGLGVAAGPALQAVLLFRLVTFWAPVPVGLLAARTLRRRPPRAPEAPPARSTPAGALAR
ncbi:lysylphosphatidylglycerol synthase transmembrane domain-containing protein [Actinomadura parmotrematis]|uniref:Lysylphosphatidylglycerol synthase domain-containing protein n=1 Tax=Actinomadura parmotrematis TaxID=2864039 RepID=A0ABS7FZP9_9ACTN|nr:lysylphosphatidylglycerol synthase domain-containing protein [Actinomadura parmotrematis]MBW8485620.1 lysylphosphatidylglycerol synthase domain-containing protein [Actinomadura parmotrematis]